MHLVRSIVYSISTLMTYRMTAVAPADGFLHTLTLAPTAGLGSSHFGRPRIRFPCADLHDGTGGR